MLGVSSEHSFNVNICHPRYQVFVEIIVHKARVCRSFQMYLKIIINRYWQCPQVVSLRNSKFF